MWTARKKLDEMAFSHAVKEAIASVWRKTQKEDLVAFNKTAKFGEAQSQTGGTKENLYRIASFAAFVADPAETYMKNLRNSFGVKNLAGHFLITGAKQSEKIEASKELNPNPLLLQFSDAVCVGDTLARLATSGQHEYSDFMKDIVHMHATRVMLAGVAALRKDPSTDREQKLVILNAQNGGLIAKGFAGDNSPTVCQSDFRVDRMIEMASMHNYRVVRDRGELKTQLDALRNKPEDGAGDAHGLGGLGDISEEEGEGKKAGKKKKKKKKGAAAGVGCDDGGA